MCNMNCAGDSQQICGGYFLNSVYSLSLLYDSGIATSTNFTYIGCAVDPISFLGFRALPYLAADDSSMTPQRCYTLCTTASSTYSYFGVQFAKQCFCGTRPYIYSSASSTDCNMPCAGNNNYICGGTNRNSVYRIVGGGLGDTDLAVVGDANASDLSKQPVWVIPVAVVVSVVAVFIVVVIIYLVMRGSKLNTGLDFEMGHEKNVDMSKSLMKS